MATATFTPNAYGDRPFNQQHKLHTKTKTTAAGSPTSTMTTATSTASTAGTGQGVETNSNEDVQNEEDHEPDVFALPGALASEAKDHRLAGFEAGDMFASDTPQTSAGTSASGDDDDYAGVDEVSDEDEIVETGRRNVRRAVEQDLIEEFERTEEQRETGAITEELDAMILQHDDATAARELGLAYAEIETTFNFDVNMDDDPFVGLSAENSLYKKMYSDAERALGIWPLSAEIRGRQNSQGSIGSKKKVRFADGPHETFSRSSSISSADDEEEDAGEAFPDLFDVQDDPALRQQFGLDYDLDASFNADLSDAGSCYDFDGEEEKIALAIDDEESDSDGMSDSNDDDSDDGDTTDEEDLEALAASLEAATPKRQTPPAKKKPSFSTPTPKGRPLLQRANSTPVTPLSTGARGPRMGTFKVDRTKFVMSADKATGKMNLIPPREPNGKDKAFWERAKRVMSAHKDPRSTAYYRMRSEAKAPRRPLTAQSTLATMFDGNLDMLTNSEPDLSQPFIPDFDPRPRSSFTGQSSFSGSFEENEDETFSDINMEDFLDMDDFESDVDEPQSASASSLMSPQTELCDSFSSLDPQPRSDSLLNHLDQQRGLVGAFRHNQSFAKTISSLASHPAKRASTSEANALQKGRRAAGNTPMTPARKNRHSQDLRLAGAGIRKSVSSPLAGRRPRSRGGSLSGAGMNQTLGRSLM